MTTNRASLDGGFARACLDKGFAIVSEFLVICVSHSHIARTVRFFPLSSIQSFKIECNPSETSLYVTIAQQEILVKKYETSPWVSDGEYKTADDVMTASFKDCADLAKAIQPYISALRPAPAPAPPAVAAEAVENTEAKAEAPVDGAEAAENTEAEDEAEAEAPVDETEDDSENEELKAAIRDLLKTSPIRDMLTLKQVYEAIKPRFAGVVGLKDIVKGMLPELLDEIRKQEADAEEEDRALLHMHLKRAIIRYLIYSPLESPYTFAFHLNNVSLKPICSAMKSFRSQFESSTEFKATVNQLFREILDEFDMARNDC